MKLYYSPGACSLAPHIAAREAGFDLELIKVDLATHQLEDGRDYFAVNPRGYVPLLQLEDGSRQTEVAALLQYLGERAPGSGLMPAAGTAQRLDVLEWLAFVSSELHKVFSPWLWHKETATQRAAIARTSWPCGSPSWTASWHGGHFWPATVSPWPMPTASPSQAGRRCWA